MPKRCFIMRGASGAGKTTWISKLANNNIKICSADLFFQTEEGYKFDPTKLPDAHNFCLREFLQALQNQVEEIVVDNTNAKCYEIAPYYRLAEAFGYEVEIIWCIAPADLCFSRNQHQTPLNVIQAMISGVESLPPWWKIKVVV